VGILLISVEYFIAYLVNYYRWNFTNKIIFYDKLIIVIILSFFGEYCMPPVVVVLQYRLIIQM
jgi:hypothetical protein